jgi:chitin synthase
MDPNTAQSYEPQISRSRSSASRVEDGLTTGVRPRRQKSLVRPERERIDPNHRQFHYRQRATEHLGVDRVAASTTGNIPLHYQDVTERRAQRLPSFRRSIRRGKSILGREEPPKEKTHVRPATKPLPKAVGDRGGADTSEEGIDSAAPANAVVLDNELPKGKLPDVWSLYVRALTCCFPSGVLRSLGKQPLFSSKLFSTNLEALFFFVLGGSKPNQGERESIKGSLNLTLYPYIAYTYL